MRKLIVLLVSLVGVGVWFAPAPANASETCYFNYEAATVAESMCWPITTDTVVFESEYRNVWGLRQFANWMDDQIDLRIIAGRYVDCADHPEATCYTVEKDYFTAAEYGDEYFGAVTYTDSHRIVLNTRYNGSEWKLYRLYLAKHEFLHALGMAHHNEVGLLGPITGGVNDLPLVPSYDEMALLENWYEQ